MGFVARFIARLHATRDGDASLLDRCMIVYGAGIADSNRHTHERLPVLVLGKGNGSLRTSTEGAQRGNSDNIAVRVQCRVLGGRAGIGSVASASNAIVVAAP